MADAMVTGRMSQQKKDAGNRILAEAGLNASQAVNLLYDRLIADDNAEFLMGETTKADWEYAFIKLDEIVERKSEGKRSKKGAK